MLSYRDAYKAYNQQELEVTEADVRRVGASSFLSQRDNSQSFSGRVEYISDDEGEVSSPERPLSAN